MAEFSAVELQRSRGLGCGMDFNGSARTLWNCHGLVTDGRLNSMQFKKAFIVTSLKYLMEQFGLLLAGGKLKSERVMVDDKETYHRLSFSEETWPDVCSVTFKPIEISVPEVKGEPPEKTLLREMVSAPESFLKVCKLLKDYNVSRDVKWLLGEIRDVHKLHKGHIHLFDAFTQEGSYEVEVYHIRPESLLRHRDLNFQATLSPKQAAIDELGSLGMYQRVALLSVPPTIEESQVADFVYANTQNLETDWKDNQNVISLTDFARSSQVGDVFVVGATPQVVSGIGFCKLSMFFPREPDAVKARYDLESDGPSF